MADSKLSALAALAGADTASGDLFYVDDVSATTSKSITRAELAIGMNATQAEVDAGTATNKLLPPSLNKVSLLATQATTSGTSKDFTIPAGARKIVIEFVGVSTNGTSNLLVQIGDAGGIEATGYLGTASQDAAAANYTTGFGINVATAAAILHGAMKFSLVDAATFTWVATHSLGRSDAAALHGGAGSKSLSQELTTVRVTTVNGTDAFDAGLVGCAYIR